jgi:hypothetical protein
MTRIAGTLPRRLKPTKHFIHALPPTLIVQKIPFG